MKKTLISLLLVLGSFAVQAQELKWETDVNKAISISNKTKKPMLLFFTGSDWCGWCIRLQKEVLKTPEFAKWAKENAHKKRESRAKRRAVLLKATPKWADTNSIKLLYKEADSISKFANIKFEVDHIIPLQGKNVCGLHVLDNLRIISLVENRKKANLWHLS